MANDFTDSGQFADNVIDQTLDQLRDHEDQEQKQTLEGEITFNPAVFGVDPQNAYIKRAFLEQNVGGEKRFLVLGPYKFTRRYAGRPRMAFGSVQQEIRDLNTVGIVVGQPSNYLPFVVNGDVFSYTYANGEVDGFYVGLYAVTRPPNGVLNHTVSWIAVGKASRYDNTQQEQSWADNWDHNDADYLTDDVTDFEGDSE